MTTRRSSGGTDWSARKLDPDYLADSGLLFALNRTVLHLIGVGLAVENNQLVLKDYRAAPEKAVFDRNTLALAQQKLDNFMREFGDAQDDRRCEKLGWGCQPSPRE
jgi:hypothetical protein